MVLLALAILAGAGYGIYRFVTRTPNLDSGAVLLPGSDNDGAVFPWADGVLCVDKRQLICTNTKGESLWHTELPEENMKAARQGDLTAAWGGTVVVIIDAQGQVVRTQTTTGDVVTVAPGKTQYAVVTREENQHRMRLYTVKDGTQVDEELFPYQSVIGVGFYGTDLIRLWTLSIDSHGTTPVTRLMTYYPGKTTTGEQTMNDEVGYLALLEDKATYLVGTHTLTTWQQPGGKKESKLIYGWNLQDMLEEPNGRVSFLFAPSGGEDAADQISMLWYINSAGDEYRIPLPAGCIRAMLKANNRLCVVTRNGVYSMNLNGSGSRFYPVSFTVESIPAVVPGKALVAQGQHRNYLIPMP